MKLRKKTISREIEFFYIEEITTKSVDDLIAYAKRNGVEVFKAIIELAINFRRGEHRHSDNSITLYVTREDGVSIKEGEYYCYSNGAFYKVDDIEDLQLKFK